MADRIKGEDIAMELPNINMITQQEFCDHIVDDDFLLRYGNPVAIKADDGTILICMAVQYYERLTGKKIEYKNNQ